MLEAVSDWNDPAYAELQVSDIIATCGKDALSSDATRFLVMLAMAGK